MHIQIISHSDAGDERVQAHRIHQNAQIKPWSLATFLDCTTAPYFAAFALEEKRVVGYALVLEVVDEATLMDIAVESTCRGQGVGRALVNYVKHSAKSNGMSSMWLEVRASNLSAIHLYETTGFEQIEVRKGYYQSATGHEDAKIMMASL